MKKKYINFLLLHGSKDLKWKKNFINVIKMLKKVLFFLNISKISCINNLKENLINYIIFFNKKYYKMYKILPLFMGKGKHIKVDFFINLKNLLFVYNKNYFHILKYIWRSNIFKKKFKKVILELLEKSKILIK